MKIMMKNVNISTLLLIGLLIALIGYRVGAERIAPSTPATVAVIDLSTVLDGLAQRDVAATQLIATRDAFKAEGEQREAEITSMREQRDELRRQAMEDPAKTAQADAAEEQLALKTLQYQAWMQFTADQLDLDQALLWQDLYRTIKREAAKMAEAEGYDLVLVNDSQGELSISPDSRASRAMQVEQQISQRLILYCNPTINITADLIERMNNAYRAAP